MQPAVQRVALLTAPCGVVLAPVPTAQSAVPPVWGGRRVQQRSQPCPPCGEFGARVWRAHAMRLMTQRDAGALMTRGTPRPVLPTSGGLVEILILCKNSFERVAPVPSRNQCCCGFLRCPWCSVGWFHRAISRAPRVGSSARACGGRTPCGS